MSDECLPQTLYTKKTWDFEGSQSSLLVNMVSSAKASISVFQQVTMTIMYYIIKQSMHYVSHVYPHFSESPISWCNNISLCNPIYHLLWVHHQRNANL